MPKKKQITLSEEDIRADRMTKTAEKIKAANKLLAEARQEQDELGQGPDETGDPNDPNAPPFLAPPEMELSEILEKNPLWQEAFDKAEGGYFKVFFMRRGEAEMCGQFDLHEFPAALNHVVKELGGGTYKVELRGPSGLVVKRVTQTYNEKMYKPSEEASKQPPADNTASILAVIQDSNKATMSMLTGLLTALLTRKEDTGMFKTAQDVASIAALFKSNEKSGDSFEKLIEVLQTGIELGKTIGGGESGDGSLMTTLVKAFAPAIKPVAEQVALGIARSQNPRGKNLPASVPKKLDAPAEKLPEVALTKPEWKRYDVFLPFVPKLLEAAKVGADVVAVSEQVLDSVPEFLDDSFYDLIASPDLVEILAQKEPDVKEHKEWFLNLAAEMLKSFDAEGEPPTEIVTPEPEKVPVAAGKNGEVELTHQL